MEELTPDRARLVDEPLRGPTRDYVGYGRRPPPVRWPGGARVALNIVVNYEEGSEYSVVAGDGRNETLGELPHHIPAPTRDLRAESVFEYGSRAGIWRLLRIFDEFGVGSTFFASAVALERNLELAAAVREAGHEVAGHGWRWSEHWTMDREEERTRLRAAIRSIERTCGERPCGWYCRYGPSVHTRELLVEEGGFLYDSDAYNDDIPYFVEVGGRRHLVLPYTLVFNDIRYPFLGYGSPADFYETCRSGLDCLWDEGATAPRMMTIGLHPRLAGQPGRSTMVRNLLEYALEKGDVWIATRLQIAHHWREHTEGSAS